MYSYLMSAGGWAENGEDTMPLGRYYCKDEYALENGKVPDALLELPALFMPEVDRSIVQFARVGKVRSGKVQFKDVKLEYSFDAKIPPIPVPKIVELAEELSISTGGYYLSHTHWDVNDANLFEVLLRSDAAKIPQPTVFKFDYAQYDPKLVAVMMPFGAKFDPVYKTIKGAVEDAGFRCTRADDLWLHHHIIQTIVSLISQSGLVIADCSDKNPNVFYEAGIAHSLGKDVILIAQSLDDIPFDLRHISILTYFPNKEGLKDLKAKLTKRIHDVTNPVRRA